MRVASWVIVKIATGEPVMETYNSKLVSLLKPEFKAVPILEYLCGLNSAT